MDKLFKLDEAILSFSYLLLPIFLGFFHLLIKKSSKWTPLLFFYYLLVGVVFQGLLTGWIQIFEPNVVSAYVDWPMSPFILELGMANAAFGLLALLSLWRKQWQIPAAIGYSFFLLFTGIGHVIELFQKGATAGNAGGFLYSDCFLPIIFFTLLLIQNNKATKDENAV